MTRAPRRAPKIYGEEWVLLSEIRDGARERKKLRKEK